MNRTDVAILTWTVIAVIYSLYAVLCLPAEQTVSATVARWCQRYPVLPFALGLLVGHWLWRMKGE